MRPFPYLRTALALSALLVCFFPRRVGQVPPPRPPPSPCEVEQWAAVGPWLHAPWVQGSLPAPITGQKAAEHCDPDLGEEAHSGGCWMLTRVPPPCPGGKLWEHEKKCWRPVPKSGRVPTSGEPQPGGVALPP